MLHIGLFNMQRHCTLPILHYSEWYYTHSVYTYDKIKKHFICFQKNWPTHHLTNDYYKKKTDLHITNNKQIWFPLKTKFNMFEGLYSWGKSHILWLAVPVQCITKFCNSTVKETEIPENSSSEDDEVSNDNEPESQRAHETEHNSSTQHDEESVPDTIVTAEATDVVGFIVKSCLAQIWM